jgi:hypothetical protein
MMKISSENKSSSTDLLDHVDSPDQEIQEILQTKESKKLYVDSDKNNTNTDTAADSGNERECVHSALTTTDNASIEDLKVYTSLLSLLMDDEDILCLHILHFVTTTLFNQSLQC